MSHFFEPVICRTPHFSRNGSVLREIACAAQGMRNKEHGDNMDNISLLVNSLEYIECHLKDNIKTTDIARACYCSRSTLEKMFHYVYHISVRDYLIRRRMMAAGRLLTTQPELSILSVAVEYGYNSHEAFSRAFKEIWNCNPSEFRKRKYTELFPRLREPIQIQKGDSYTMNRRNFDISQLYDLFRERKDCYFVCCDIKSLIPINDISHKAGDLAILESIRRMEAAAGEDDIVFRIGGDEFCILTSSTSREYAEHLAESIRSHNEKTFVYEDKQIPLSLYVAVTRAKGPQIKYNELFTELHLAIMDSKPE